MGAKQSKRSVDISGKEAEGAGEVAAAGAGGEGRVEPLADADALKPQLNGDAHIHEQTDKEKQLDIGTPENEKDATTEKEGKQDESEKDKAETPVTNGDGEEQKTENGDSAPTPEDAKKPKKEKVKKKWSLRSISFSRKDKPKQEKKQKEEEPKTNSEPEKVPEEAAEVVPEPATNEVAEVKSENESKEEKTPETPVTEPITNGSNTPESPKVEIPIAEETAPVASPESDKTEPETQPEPEPDQLPVNGLSLEETKIEATELPKVEGSQPDESPAESTETVPAVEIPVQKEVCVEPMPLIEPTPPPLPANPPPSSVASFAATTMAPDLTDASLVNNTETAKCTPPITVLDTKTDAPNEQPAVIQADLTNSVSSTEVPSSLNKAIDHVEEMVCQADSVCNETTPKVEEVISEITSNIEVNLSLTNVNNDCDVVLKEQLDIFSNVTEDKLHNLDEIVNNSEPQEVLETIKNEVLQDVDVIQDNGSPILPLSESLVATSDVLPISEPPTTEVLTPTTEDFPPPTEDLPPATEDLPSTTEDLSPDTEDLPPPPPVDEDIIKTELSTEQIEIPPQEKTHDVNEVVNCNHFDSEITQTNGTIDEPLNGNEETENENIKNKIKDTLENVNESIGCNGNTETATAEAPSETAPAPPAAPAEPEPCAPQEVLPVSDKIADLIPEVPVVPELKAETELAVAEQ